MGNFWCCRTKNRRDIVLLLLGLDNAGKTVTVKKLAGEDSELVVPTVGFSVVELKFGDYNISVYDLGGRSDFRDVWQRYYVDAYGIIFVIDSSDYERVHEAQAVLHKVVSNEKVRGKPILLLANKQDNENALDEIDLIEKLDLEDLANENECPTLIQTCCANNSKKLDSGIKLGYNWLINCIIKNHAALHKRVRSDVEHQLKLDEAERNEKLQRIKLYNEQEKTRNTADTNGQAHGDFKNIEDIFVVKNTQRECDVESVGSSDSELIVHNNSAKTRSLHESSRPKSATNLVRRQLQLKMKRRSSLNFNNNKSTPLNVIGVKTPKSASITNTSLSQKQSDRRNLKSAGDSVFIVSENTRKVMPINNGSGDLSMFGPPVRKGTPNKLGARELKEVLPPINDINNMYHLQNGSNYF